MPGFPVGAFIAAALGVHLIAAWYNAGFLNADEHYQIIEFAQYKLGRQAASGLAWEFAATMRPALQPWIAAGAIRLAEAVGVVSPFAIAFALRLVSTLLALWVSLELCARVLRTVTSSYLKMVALSLSVFLWIVPTIHGRFSSENWGAALLAAGLCLMIDSAEAWPAERTRSVALAIGTGLLWSAAFYCRFQVGAAIAGAGLWLLAIRRARLPLVAIAVSFAVGCGLNESLDRWLYGVWTLVPYNYLVVNLVQGKAAGFGRSPWWMVPVYLLAGLIPPFSFVIVALLLAGVWYARRELLVWTVVPFVVLHAAIAHKEPRFLIPVLYFVGPLVALSVQALPDRVRAVLKEWRHARWARIGVATACAVNFVMLCVAISVPANDTIRLDRWLREQGGDGDFTLYMVDRPPYHAFDAVTDTFYLSRHVTFSHIDTRDRLSAAVDRAPAFIYYWGIAPPAIVSSVGTCTPLLRTFPEWFGRLPVLVAIFDVHVATVCRLDALHPAGERVSVWSPRS
jgi:phosphatidylinositol glycan class B